MFDNFNTKRKDPDCFHIHDKRYVSDVRTVSKMGAKGLQDLVAEQDKYIFSLAAKIQQAKQLYERTLEKNQQLQQKYEIVNGQIVHMTNEQDELSMKVENLQKSLQMLSKQNDAVYRKQLQFIVDNQIPADKIKSLSAVLELYREKLQLFKKVETQNRNLKSKLVELEQSLQQSNSKLQAVELEKTFNNTPLPIRIDNIQQIWQKPTQTSSVKPQTANSSIATMPTFRTEEEQEDRNQPKLLPFNQTNYQLLSIKQQLAESQTKKKELQSAYDRNAERLKVVEGQLAQTRIQLNMAKNSEKQAIVKLDEMDKRFKKQAKQNLQVNALTAQIGNLKSEKANLISRYDALNKSLTCKQEQNSKLQAEHQKMKQTMVNKQQQLQREREGKNVLESMMSDQNNSQINNLLKIKTKLQHDLHQLRTSHDNVNITLGDYESQIKHFKDQAQSLNAVNQFLLEEKETIQENYNSSQQKWQQQAQQYQSTVQSQRKQVEDLNKQLSVASHKIKNYEEQIRNYANQIERLVRTIQARENEIKKVYSTVQQTEKQKIRVEGQLSELEQQNKVRIRKYEIELNQSYINTQSLNNKLESCQLREEESKRSMDDMYEQLVVKEKMNVCLQTKLKQYKVMIQTLRKEKAELEDTYLAKIKDITSTPQIQQIPSNKVITPPEEEESPKDLANEKLTNELLSTKQHNLVLLAENEDLRKRIEQLNDTVNEKEDSIKQLQEKRNQIMKEIEKMGKKSIAANTTDEKTPTVLERTQSKQQEGRQSRQKKIASKAQRGFQILLKLQQHLYKDFITVFTKQLARQDVKAIQGEINTLIKRSTDMYDIFEDYL